MAINQRTIFEICVLLLEDNQRIEAVKFLCRIAHYTLFEAKEYIKYIEKKIYKIRDPWYNDPGLYTECISYISQNKKIMAIKRCREITDWDLKKSKEYVDYITSSEKKDLNWVDSSLFKI